MLFLFMIIYFIIMDITGYEISLSSAVFPCMKEHAIWIDNHSAIPVYLIHKTDKTADIQVNRHEKYT